MCHLNGERFGLAGHHRFGSSCSCPAMMSIEEEIHLLEDHKKFMEEQLEVMDKKIAALKSAKEA